MRVNLDHAIIKKQQQSRQLEVQVRQFLRKHKLEEPVQIPTGTSLYLKHCEENNIKPFSTNLRDSMTSYVEEARAKKAAKAQKIYVSAKSIPSTLKVGDTPVSDAERRVYNYQARAKAWQDNQAKFIGYCDKSGHRWNTFIIRSTGKDHICSACNAASQKKRRDRLKKQGQA